MGEPARLVLTALPDLPAVKPGDSIAEIVRAGLVRAELSLVAGDVLVIAQKIVSKAENRFVALADVTPSARARALAAETEKDPCLVELILAESQAVLRARPGALIVEHRLGHVCANAGIDTSNVGRGAAGEFVLLLPEDPERSAAAIKAELERMSGARIGVVVNDSVGRAWRTGSVGIALGVSGLAALLDLRGRPDLDRRRLQATEIGLGDEIAAAASLVMGQADEARPVVHLRGLPYPLATGSVRDLLRPKERDLFR